MDEIHFSVYDGVHVVLDVLRVGGDDRAVVMVVRLFKFVPLIRDGRIEDVFDAFIDQPLYMSVRQLGRVTLGLTGDGLDTQLVDLSRRSRREYHAEAEFREKCKPERIVLVHVQHPRDADDASFCL